MGILGPKVTLKITTEGPYQPGDVIEGMVMVDNGSEFSVQNLDVMLRCSENAHSHYYESYGLQTRRREIYNTNRVFSHRQTLFPTHECRQGFEMPVFFGSFISKPSNRWNEDYKNRYTVSRGKHTFDFALQVPAGYPSTLAVSVSNTVSWVVCAKLFKGGTFSVAREAHIEVPVYSGGMVGYVPGDVFASSETRHVKVYLEGYQKATKSASGFFKNLGHSDFKTEEKVCFTLFVPSVGLLQSPHAAHLRLALDCAALEHIMVKQVVLRLKRKVWTTLRERSLMHSGGEIHHEVFRTELTIYSRSIQLPCVAALEEVNADLDSLKITGNHTDSFSSLVFDVSYKLVAEITFASRERPSSTDKVRVSVPVTVQSPLVSVSHMDPSAKLAQARAMPVDEEALPAYEPPPGPPPAKDTKATIN